MQIVMDNTGRIPFPFKIATAELDAEFYARAYLRKMPDIFCFSKTFITVEMMLSIIRKAFPQIVYNENKGDKHLHIPIQLKNADGQLVTGRVVPLKVTLRYCNGELVRPTYVDRPTLLQLMPEYPRVESDGTCTIKARIMQISRNHCNRHFILRIEPDLAININNCDIGYTECGPFEVRTKLVEKESAKRKSENKEEPGKENGHAHKRDRAFSDPSIVTETKKRCVECSEDGRAASTPLPSRKSLIQFE